MKKQLWIIAIVAALAIVLGIVFFGAGNNAEKYNTSATNHAQNALKISKQDILILKSLTKNPGEDTKAEFYIYRLPEGAKAEDYLHLEVSEVKADSGLVHMGSASCTFVGDDPNSIYNLTTLFLR